MSGLDNWAIVAPSENVTMEWTVDPVVVDPEELVCLDHLEALVHQGGRVNGDLRAHCPCGVGQCLLDGHGRQVRSRSATEWSSGCGQDNARHALGHIVGAKALVDRTVLAVHGQ